MTLLEHDDDNNDDNNHHRRQKTIHIAPMLDVTNRECRYLLRILSKRVVLWTEMVVDTTIIYCDDINFHLEYDRDISHPIICQIGGNDPTQIKQATLTVLKYGYDEINLNMGCPSNHVTGKRRFGAILMKQIDIAETIVEAMIEATTIHLLNNNNNNNNKQR